MLFYFRLKSLGILWIAIAFAFSTQAQDEIHHWESAVLDGTSWHYLVPTGQPAADWIEQEFDDSLWPEGPSGFGYGDGDDATLVSSTPSLYLRHTFSVQELDSWLDVDFLMDYYDGFVAYLN